MMGRTFGFIGIISLLLISSVRAEIINFHADSVTYKMRQPREILCTGHSVVSNTNNVIKADRISITGIDLDTAKFYKHVFFHDIHSDLVLRSDYVEYYQKKDYIRLLQKPVLTAKDLVIHSDDMERYNAESLSVVQGNVVITRSNDLIICQTGRFDEKSGRINLKGDPQVTLNKDKSSAGDNFTCGEIIYYNGKNRVILSRNVQGIINLKE
jgi:lipopolysaccharide export system protein LptA